MQCLTCVQVSIVLFFYVYCMMSPELDNYAVLNLDPNWSLLISYYSPVLFSAELSFPFPACICYYAVIFAYVLVCENEVDHTSVNDIFEGLSLEFCGVVPLNQPNMHLLWMPQSTACHRLKCTTWDFLLCFLFSIFSFLFIHNLHLYLLWILTWSYFNVFHIIHIQLVFTFIVV